MRQTLDFIVIGAAKSGTTSLFEHLRKHPEVALPPDKEAAYFSNDSRYARGWDDYLKRTFPFADPARRWGTITPQYMFGTVFNPETTSATPGTGYDEHTVPLRIQECLPAARLVAILRDPIERARSDYQMSARLGREQRSFCEAIEAQLSPESLADSRSHVTPDTLADTYVVRGEYGRILTGYFDTFPREQILVVFTEELNRTPEQVLRRICEFIGVASDFAPRNLHTRYNVSASEPRLSRFTPEAVQRAIARNPVARRVWRSLPESSRRRTLTEFRRLSFQFNLWNRRGSGTRGGEDESAGDAPATIDRLRRHFSLDAERLTDLLGYPPPWELTAASADSARRPKRSV